jgi:hypothetical protein
MVTVPTRPLYTRWWLWTTVGTVTIGVVVLGAVLGTRARAAWSNAPDIGPGSRSGLTVTW